MNETEQELVQRIVRLEVENQRLREALNGIEICPACGERCKGRRGLGVHWAEIHRDVWPECFDAIGRVVPVPQVKIDV